MSTQQEEISAVDRFREDMLRKLRANCHKEHWRTAGFERLFKLLAREVVELLDAQENQDHQGMINEAADVANFAMMIADNVKSATIAVAEEGKSDE